MTTKLVRVAGTLVICLGVGQTVLGPLAASEASPVSSSDVFQVERQTEAASAEAERAIELLKSPFCPGLMLEVCPTDSARVLREEIEAMAGSGLDSDSIVEVVVAQRGEIYRALPLARGRGLLAWVAPPLAILLGLAGIFFFLRGSLAPAPPEAAAVTADEAERVRAELEKLER